jgi:hypothetical protein
MVHDKTRESLHRRAIEARMKADKAQSKANRARDLATEALDIYSRSS